jgi:hypothetical protein
MHKKRIAVTGDDTGGILSPVLQYQQTIIQ